MTLNDESLTGLTLRLYIRLDCQIFSIQHFTRREREKNRKERNQRHLFRKVKSKTFLLPKT